MDRGRAAFLQRLRTADGSGRRLRTFYPVTAADGVATPINLHSKLMVVDDRLLVVGSANLANRSMGLDSECVLALAAEDARSRLAVGGRARRCWPSIWAASRRCSPGRMRSRAP